ncbi:MAG TPA: DUF5050 domain-containing protein, partial [Blastocatellia bacterium]|nr:DUF5050 domain-containing protein [Blastocatellia bacterium]
YTIPSLGGTERRLTGTWSKRFDFGSHTWLHWSPDGKWLALSDKTSEGETFSLYLVSPATGEKHRLTTPPASDIGDCSPAFSPDGKSVAFVRVSGAGVGDIYLVPVDGGEPRRITFDGTDISSMAWTPGGRELIFAVRHGERSRLFRIPVEGGTPTWVAASGSDARYPAFSRQGGRLAWTQHRLNTDIFRIAIKDSGDSSKPVSGEGLITSTLEENAPSYSPDGKRIVFASGRSGNPEIWACGNEGENPIRLTSFGGPLSGSPRWSPDGKLVVFDGRPDRNADIFIVSGEGGQMRRLTTDPAEDIVPSWSHDGRWIYFTSNRTGRLQIWKMPADGGEAVQVTKQGGFEAVESPDGQWLYYTQDRGSSAIRRMPVNGGEETLLYDFHQTIYSRMWTVAPEGIYFATAESTAVSAIKFLSLPGQNVSTVASIDGKLANGVSALTVSPDSKWILFPLVVERGGDLMIIENFR